MNNKKVKQMMRDNIEHWTEYHCEYSSRERYTEVCNRACGLFKNLNMMGVQSLTANQLKGIK